MFNPRPGSLVQTVNAARRPHVIVGEKKLPRNLVKWCFDSRTERPRRISDKTRAGRRIE